jgi:glycosyltransferase involved in cell wall biosynthesis
MPKVSICIPAYQQVEYLSRALASLVEQTFQDYEVIVTDDSPDTAVETLLQAYGADGRFKYLRNPERLGSPRNWSRAIELTSGEYVKILHHDDWFAGPDSLSKFVALLDADPEVTFAFSGSQVVDVVNGGQRLHKCPKHDFELLTSSPEILFRANLIGAPSATIFRRSAYVVEFDARLKWLVDVDFYIAMLRHSGRVAMTSAPLIVTPTKASHQVTESCLDNAEVELFEYQYLFKKYADRLGGDRKSKRHLRNVFESYCVRTQDDLKGLGVPLLISAQVFESLGMRRRSTVKAINIAGRILGKVKRCLVPLPSSHG